ncbi:hypothetical protein DUI87_29725 [Hirundo rustica rustica]|uniref:KRAB domain-containing protein n=1 Tax=Hirundo rustica rustica TaxID=333673 RepID=A0A3M0IZ63_HIRRU|nr:hypothetical protein DUI87_29725 [Hirundo rustica rustica]
MAGQAQEPVTFEDVMVFLSRAEWDVLPTGRRQLYRDVVSDTYELLTSLGYPGPKPDILHRMERGEEPWICSSSEHDGSWLEEPSSDLCSGASGYQGLETSCPGWSTLWCLQDRSFPKKLGCDEGRSEFPSRADSRVGSQTQPWLVKEEAEHELELMEDAIQSETFPLHSEMEQQSLDPWEQLWADPGEGDHGNAQNHGHTLGEATLLPGTSQPSVEELRAAVGKDHSYCLRSELGTHRAPGLRSLREHNYSWQRRAGKSRGVCGHGAACAMCRWLTRRRSSSGGMVRRAGDILRWYRPYRRLALPWRRRGAARGKKPGARGPRELRGARNAEGVTSDARCAPEGNLGTGASIPALSWAAEAEDGAKPPKDPGASQELEGCAKGQKSQRMSLQDVFRDVMGAVGYILDSICRKFELQGFSQGKSIWPIVIQIDNLSEIRKP